MPAGWRPTARDGDALSLSRTRLYEALQVAELPAPPLSFARTRDAAGVAGRFRARGSAAGAGSRRRDGEWVRQRVWVDRCAALIKPGRAAFGVACVPRASLNPPQRLPEQSARQAACQCRPRFCHIGDNPNHGDVCVKRPRQICAWLQRQESRLASASALPLGDSCLCAGSR